VFEKQRPGKSQIAQSVGMTGRITITASINNFNVLKVIYKLPAVCLYAGMSDLQPDKTFYSRQMYKL